MKTAVVFYSQLGNTRQTAEKIANILDADMISVEPEKAYPDKGFKKFFWGGKSATMKEAPELIPYEFDADKYEQIIIGFPVWAGTFTPPIRTFVNEHKDISGKRIAVFACQSGAGAQKAFIKLKEHIGVDGFADELILIDPKDKPDPENDKKIADFCDKLK